VALIGCTLGRLNPFDDFTVSGYSPTGRHAVIDRENVGIIDAETRGLWASIGIRKGRPFAPDERMANILRDAAAVANATARSLLFQPRDPGAYVYDGSHWKTGFVGGDYR
jgi:hypothetical protein